MLKLVALAAIVALLWWFFSVRPRASRAAPMTAAEALGILGLAPGATADAIRAAHRRLIAQVHPDSGGSAELARRVNAARDAALAALHQETKT